MFAEKCEKLLQMLFFSKHISVCAIFNDQNFNDTLTNMVSFEQMGLVIFHVSMKIQSTLVISNSKGFSEILRDILTSTYQICRIEEK